MARRGVARFGATPGLIPVWGRTSAIWLVVGPPTKHNANTSTGADVDTHVRGPMVDDGHMPGRFKQDDGPPPIPRYPVSPVIPSLCLAFFVNDPHQVVGHQPNQALVRDPALISAFQIR